MSKELTDVQTVLEPNPTMAYNCKKSRGKLVLYGEQLTTQFHGGFWT